MPEIVQLNFNRAELSPGVIVRTDTQAAAIGLSKCRNAFVTVEGGVVRRAGTRFIGNCQYFTTQASVLIPFTAATEDTYILEFTGDRMRIIRGGGFVVFPVGHPSAGTIVEVVTPFTQTDVEKLYYTQSVDIMLLATGNKPIQELKRSDHHLWAITAFAASPPPWRESNLVTTFTVAVAGAQTGNVTLTSSAPLFGASIVGALLKLEESPAQIAQVTPWEASKLLVKQNVNPNGLYSRSDGKVYKIVNNATMPNTADANCYSGTYAPRHTEGTYADGNKQAIPSTAHQAGVDWQYEHSGLGIVRIIDIISPTQATATVISTLPHTIAGSSTYKWAYQVWNADDGYPQTLGFYGGRFYAARNRSFPETVWGAEVQNRFGFGVSSPIKDDDAVEFDVSGQSVNAVQHILPMSDLIVMTTKAEWLVRGGQEKVITPSSVGDRRIQGYNGASSLRPLIIGTTALYAQAAGSEIRSLGFAVNPDGSDGYGGRELSVFSKHLFLNRSITSWCFARQPWSLVWAVRDDGKLLSFLYMQEQDAWGWGICETKGKVRRVASVQEGGIDRVYLVVERVIEGQIRFSIELMTDAITESPDNYCFLDCALTRNGWKGDALALTSGNGLWDTTDTITLTATLAPFVVGDVGKQIHIRNGLDISRFKVVAFSGSNVLGLLPLSAVPLSLRGVASEHGFAVSTVAGLSHLNGQVVSVFADNNVQTDKTVASGGFTLDIPAVVVSAGLPYVTELQTLPFDIAAPQTIRHQKKNIKKAYIGLTRTRGAKVGQDTSLMSEIIAEGYTDVTRAMPEEEYIASESTKGIWNSRGQLTIIQDNPLPMHVTSVALEVQIGG